MREEVRVGLQFADPPGATLHSSSLRTPGRSELFDNTALSDGIVFLIDPIRELRSRNTFEFVNGVLVQLMQKTSYQTGALRGRPPHYVAVCITKRARPTSESC
jgi:hypothetical protein